MLQQGSSIGTSPLSVHGNARLHGRTHANTGVAGEFVSLFVDRRRSWPGVRRVGSDTAPRWRTPSGRHGLALLRVINRDAFTMRDAISRYRVSPPFAVQPPPRER